MEAYDKYDYLEFREINTDMVDELAKLMDETILEDLQMHEIDIKDIKPINHVDMLNKFAFHKDSTALAFYIDDELIGSVIYWANSEKAEGLIGHILVKFKCSNMGIGKKVCEYVLQKETAVKTWYTEPPMFSRRALHFFINKLGFHMIKINNPKSPLNSSCLLQLKK